MKSSLTSPQVAQVLEALYADAAQKDPLVHQAAREAEAKGAGPFNFFQAARKAYMAVGRDFGHLLYTLARASRARRVVEFGTSFGVSTIFLASAMRDNGGGKVITCEFEPEKSAQARKNLIAAGLEECVEFRVGDALETLSPPPSAIDLVFLDGAKDLYLSVLKILEPQLHAGSIVASDNTDHDGMESFLTHIRDAGAGYTSSAIVTGGDRCRGHEVSIRH